MKITIAGAGYVGFSLAVLLSQKYNVTLFEIDEKKVDLINNKESPIEDKELKNFIKHKNLLLNATSKKQEAFDSPDYVVISTPTNYDPHSGSFDTSSVREIVNECNRECRDATIIIKSTIPLGFTDVLRNEFSSLSILFSPEFLRESNSLFDNLYPSRIVIGDKSKKGETFAKMLVECSALNSSDVKVIKMTSSEAEAVKLFSNTYLAMRVAYFNELDSLCKYKIYL